MDTLSSRDKNDRFWVKKRRYMVSSDIKCKTQKGYFNPDMVAEVKSAYEKDPKGVMLYELTGNEFADRPPTASGEIAFAKSIALMMHTAETIDSSVVSDRTADPTAAFFADIIDDTKTLIKVTIDAFFEGCGVDSEGNEFKDRARKEAAQEEFYTRRDEYEMLIKTERRTAGAEMIDVIREANGIDEEMETDENGEDPNLIRLLEDNKDAVEEHKEEIEALCEISRKALIEVASIRAGKLALFMPVKKRLEDESQSEGTRKLLRSGFDSYLFDVDMRIRGLLYRSEAVYYMIRWMLLREPVDEIIAARIAGITKEKPAVIENFDKISIIPGYSAPKEDYDLTIPEYDDKETLFEMGEKVRNYLKTHPYQFESQCLRSIVEDLDELSGILPISWALLQAIEMLTLSEKFNELSDEEKQQIFDIWVLSDVFCKIGYSITETIIDDPEKTVKETTEILKSLAPMLSYTATEKEVRNILSQVILERSGAIVY